MHWGLGVNVMQNVYETIQICTMADKGGIDKLWVIDFPSQRHAFTLSVAIADETKTTIGVGVISPLLYQPSQIIQAMESLIDNFGTRFELLLGVGDKYQLGNIGVGYGEIRTLVSRITESIREIKHTLLEKGIKCPIWLAAQGPKMIKASLEADGVLLNYTDPSMVKWAINLLEERSNEFKIGIFPPTSVATDTETHSPSDFKFSAAIVALGITPTVSKQFNLDQILSDPKRAMKQKGKLTPSIVDSISDDLLNKFGLHGTVEYIVEYVQKLAEIGVNDIAFGPPLNQMIDEMKLLLSAKSYNFDKT